MAKETVIGDCKLINADALDVLPTIDPSTLAAVIADPPFGQSLRNKGRTSKRADDGRPVRSDRSWKVHGDDSTELATAVAAWADAHGLPLAMFGTPFSPWPGPWQSVLVWDKGEGAGAGGDRSTSWKKTYELIFVRNAGRLNGRRDGSILRHPVCNLTKHMARHICEKPVALLAYLVRKLTQPGEIVLDPCAGSFALAEACLLAGRGYIGIEIDPAHFRAGVSRIRSIVRDGPKTSLPARPDKLSPTTRAVHLDAIRAAKCVSLDDAAAVLNDRFGVRLEPGRLQRFLNKNGLALA